MRTTVLFVFAVISIGWIGFIAQAALDSWPQLSLDLSHVDPETQSAYQWAINMHVAKYASMALLPPVAIWFAGRQAFAKRK